MGALEQRTMTHLPLRSLRVLEAGAAMMSLLEDEIRKMRSAGRGISGLRQARPNLLVRSCITDGGDFRVRPRDGVLVSGAARCTWQRPTFLGYSKLGAGSESDVYL